MWADMIDDDAAGDGDGDLARGCEGSVKKKVVINKRRRMMLVVMMIMMMMIVVIWLGCEEEGCD